MLAPITPVPIQPMRVVPGTIEGVDIILIPKVVNIQPAQRDPRMLETATRMCSDARRRGLPRTYPLSMQVRSASRSLRFARPHNRLDLDANSGRAARSSFQTLPAGKTISPAKRASAVTGSSSNTRVSAPLGMSSSYIAAARHLDVFDEHPCLKCTGRSSTAGTRFAKQTGVPTQSAQSAQSAHQAQSISV